MIGYATPTGWDSDTDMVYNPSSRNLEVVLNLTVGGLKFRANNDWPLNFGDNSGDGFLDYDGANIQIKDPGSYRIELILHEPRYRYVITKLKLNLFFNDRSGESLPLNEGFFHYYLLNQKHIISRFKFYRLEFSTGEPPQPESFGVFWVFRGGLIEKFNGSINIRIVTNFYMIT